MKFTRLTTPAAAGFFLVLAILMTYPLAFHLGDKIRDKGDSLFNAWILAWNVREISRADFPGYFNANIFYPNKRTLAYSEHLLPQSLAALPVKLLSGNTLLTHNFVLILAMATSGFGMFCLARYLTGSAAAAVASGTIYAFSPFMTAHMFQVQMLTAGGIPLTFLFLHRYFEEERTRDFVLFTSFFILQILSNGYYALFLTLFTGLFIVVRAAGTGAFLRRTFWVRMAGFAAALIVVAGPFFYEYFMVQKTMGFERKFIGHAELKSFLAAPAVNRLYGEATKKFRIPEGELLPGAAAVLLAAIGFVAGLRRRGVRQNRPGVFSTTKDSERGLVLGYFGFLILAFLMTLGPHGPYVLLYKYVPGFNGIRAVSRFHVMVMTALAVLAAFGLKTLAERFRTRGKMIVLPAVLLLILIEYASIPIPLAAVPATKGDIPEVYRWLATQADPKGAVLELPLLQQGNIGRIECSRVYYSTFHWHSLVNGYSGFFPPLYDEIGRRWMRLPVSRNIDDAKSLGVRYIILHAAETLEPEFRRLRDGLTERTADVRAVGVFGEAHVFEIISSATDRLDLTPRDSAKRELPRSSWRVKASVNADRANLAVDGDLTTRWDTGPQKGGETFEIDLGEERSVRGMSLSLGDKILDSPRGCRVEASTDEIQWTTAARFPDGSLDIREFLRPKDMAYRFNFPAVRARFLRIINLGSDPVMYWSIFELKIYE